jgi:hypothetical protein
MYNLTLTSKRLAAAIALRTNPGRETPQRQIDSTFQDLHLCFWKTIPSKYLYELFTTYHLPHNILHRFVHDGNLYLISASGTATAYTYYGGVVRIFVIIITIDNKDHFIIWDEDADE